MEANPSLIQAGSSRKHAGTPLVLFHDGGGTIISYYYLGPLDRPVYGIADPRFPVGRPWNGLEEMARVYANLIRSVVPSGTVILGGWSLGGFLAMEVTKILESSHQIRVLGVVMIDSPYPHSHDHNAEDLLPAKPFFHQSCAVPMRMLVERSMKRARVLVQKWTVPEWRDLPPVMLLRCPDTVPHDSVNQGAVVSVDEWRGLPMLGWEHHPEKPIQGVLNISGHHFNTLWEEHIDSTTRQLKLACKMLELSLFVGTRGIASSK